MFALFAGDVYYPSGGWNDFRGTFDTIEAAKDRYLEGEMWGDHNHKWEWGHVVNLETRECVLRMLFGKNK